MVDYWAKPFVEKVLLSDEELKQGIECINFMIWNWVQFSYH